MSAGSADAGENTARRKGNGHNGAAQGPDPKAEALGRLDAAVDAGGELTDAEIEALLACKQAFAEAKAKYGDGGALHLREVVRASPVAYPDLRDAFGHVYSLKGTAIGEVRAAWQYAVKHLASKDAGGDRAPERDRIVAAVVKAGVTLWQDADGEAYATVPEHDGKALSHFRVRALAFHRRAALIYGDATVTGTNNQPRGMNAQAWADARGQLEARAIRGAVQPASVRAFGSEGVVWIDLGDKTFRAVRIDADGWAVVDKADAPLVRPKGMRPLPAPIRVNDPAGTVADFRKLTNVVDDDEWIRIVAWMIAALVPCIAAGVLAIDGPAGAGKTTLFRQLRALIDPKIGVERAPPRTEEDLAIAGLNARVVSYGNVSYLSRDMCDALCRLATGGGLGAASCTINTKRKSSISRGRSCLTAFPVC